MRDEGRGEQWGGYLYPKVDLLTTYEYGDGGLGATILDYPRLLRLFWMSPEIHRQFDDAFVWPVGSGNSAD